MKDFLSFLGVWGSLGYLQRVCGQNHWDLRWSNHSECLMFPFLSKGPHPGCVRHWCNIGHQRFHASQPPTCFWSLLGEHIDVVRCAWYLRCGCWFSPLSQVPGGNDSRNMWNHQVACTQQTKNNTSLHKNSCWSNLCSCFSECRDASLGLKTSYLSKS